MHMFNMETLEKDIGYLLISSLRNSRNKDTIHERDSSPPPQKRQKTKVKKSSLILIIYNLYDLLLFFYAHVEQNVHAFPCNDSEW